MGKALLQVCLLLAAAGIPAMADDASRTRLAPDVTPPDASEAVKEYVLGADDVLRVWILGLDEIGEAPIRVDSTGWISLPLVGRVQAGGLTVEQLRAALVEKMKSQIRNPKVSLSITEFGSQPVAVMGAVNTPGVHQLRGRKSLAEVLALAGGLRPDAGYKVRISRPVENGPLDLLGARTTDDGKFQVADVRTKDFLEAKNPADNILILPHDLITVPPAEMVYVIGAVHKPGGFLLNDHESVSALQALALAEGLGSTPSPSKSRILRTVPGATERKEIQVDLKKILAGKSEDIGLRPNDILFVPTSNGKKVAIRALETMVSTASGLAIFGL